MSDRRGRDDFGVLQRELEAPAELGDEVAIPHAPVPVLARPVVALGLSERRTNPGVRIASLTDM